MANRQVCPGCGVADVALSDTDGSAIRGRVYSPQHAGERLPTVIVAHGYLGNLAFMEMPWAAELTRLGAVAFFLDRRGHGQSRGTWWPDANSSTRLSDLESDLHAAVRYLRSRADGIDPERIAILGHSDGATAAIIAASADWDVQTTVAMSASVAPWQYVSHAAPRNLLLVYGAEDRFVLNETDQMLIGSATRGYLRGAGAFGALADGSARKLVRVAGSGHVDLLYSADARRAVLEWLQQALHLPGAPVLASARLGWVWGGLAAIVVFLLAPGFAAAAKRPEAVEIDGLRSPMQRAGSGLLFLIVWTGTALITPYLARIMSAFPVQQGAVFAAAMLGPAVALAVIGLALRSLRRAPSCTSPVARNGHGGGRMASAPVSNSANGGGEEGAALVLGAIYGAVAAIAVIAALQILLVQHYETAIDLNRVALWVMFGVLALPLFLTLEMWLRWVSGGRAPLLELACIAAAAAITGVTSVLFLERMSKAPGCLLAAVLVLYAAQRFGSASRSLVTPVVFGAMLLGRVAASACAFY